MTGMTALPQLPAPSAWVAEHVPTALPGARGLDIACGGGRHAVLMAQRGYQVLAVDRNRDSLALLAERWDRLREHSSGAGNIETTCLDLEGDQWPLPVNDVGCWDLIVVTNYLYRPYLDMLPAMLSAGGRLIVETFAAGNQAYGRPSNPAFLLNSGELLAYAHRNAMDVLAFEEGYVDNPKPAVTQRICARKT